MPTDWSSKAEVLAAVARDASACLGVPQLRGAAAGVALDVQDRGRAVRRAARRRARRDAGRAAILLHFLDGDGYNVMMQGATTLIL